MDQVKESTLRFITLISDLFFLNIIWLVCSLPVLTIGAATSAAYAVALKMVEDQHGGIVREFFHYFRKNFFQATALYLLMIVALAAVVADVIFAFQSSRIIMMLYLCIAVVMLIFVGAVFAFGVPMQARYENKLLMYIRNSFSLAAPYLAKMLLIWVIWWAPIVLCVLFTDVLIGELGFIWLFCGFSGLMYLHAKVIRPIFDDLKSME